MQRGRPVIVLSCYVGAVFDEEPGHTHMTHFERPKQWSRLMLVLCCRVRAVLNKEPRQIHMTP